MFLELNSATEMQMTILPSLLNTPVATFGSKFFVAYSAVALEIAALRGWRRRSRVKRRGVGRGRGGGQRWGQTWKRKQKANAPTECDSHCDPRLPAV